MQDDYYFLAYDSKTGRALHYSCFLAREDGVTAGALLNYVNSPSVTLRGLGGFKALHVAWTRTTFPEASDKTLKHVENAVPNWTDFVIGNCFILHEMSSLSSVRSKHLDQEAVRNSLYLFVACASVPEQAKKTPSTQSRTVREQIVQSIRANITSPPNDAENSNMLITQDAKRPDAVYHGRPLHLTGPPIGVFHPIFPLFQERLSETPEIDRRDIFFANALITASARYFASEGERQNAIRPAVCHFLEFSASVCTKHYAKGRIVETDGSIYAACGIYPELEIGYRAMLREITAISNGIGVGGCDPQEKAQKCYMAIVTLAELQELREISCMPAFLLTFAGPYMSISGAIFLDGVVSERLTDLVSLVPISAYSAEGDLHVSRQHAHACRIAHILHTLRKCLDDLAVYYLDLKPAALQDGELCPGPHFSSFTSKSGQVFTLKYWARIYPTLSPRAVFLADACTDGVQPVQCVVKFTPRYCREAHELMEGVAPELLYCRWEATVGAYCVVTPFVGSVDDVKPSSAGLEKLETTLGKLHAASYVHGDLREPNLFVDSTGQPRLVDFDWSGKEGTAVYPVDINTSDISWAGGVEGGGKIKREHDLEMLRRYKGSFRDLSGQ